MQVRPVKHYSDPSFPTRSILDERPELLRLVPKRWQRNPAVISALMGICALSLAAQAIASDAKSQSMNRVAPIFVHGDGMGAFGCKAVNPPVFLSEAEARVVILDEAKRAGINFVPDSLVLENIDIPITDEYGFLQREKSGGAVKPSYKTQSLTLDGTTKSGISFEYVSIEDFGKWSKGPQGKKCTVSEYEMKPIADILRDSLVKNPGAGTFGIFYDPCSGPRDVEKRTGVKTDKAQIEQWKMPKTATAEEQWKNTQAVKAEYEDMQAKARDISREELRKQVKDFIKWLKAEGVI